MIAEVERILLTHPKVSEAVVIGVPDEKWGESGKAFIVKKADLTEQDLRQHCLSNLAKFKVPKHFIFLENLLKNDTGKIDRKALKEDV